MVVLRFGPLWALITCFFCWTSVRHAMGDNLPTCQPGDFHYEYTECDSGGGRWRVSVPTPGKCTGGAPNAPIRGKDCEFTCSSGQFIDIQKDQECHPCPAGTYSLGGGIRFDDWEHLPHGFYLTADDLETRFMLNFARKSNNCSKSLWKPRGNFIAAVPGPCTSSLVYSAKLVKAGKVSFEYQYTDSETIFHFQVQNDQCQAMDDDNSKWPKETEEGKWNTVTADLKSGMNVLQWRTVGSLSDSVSTSRNPVLIRKIEISGVAYTSECTKCRNGTYSSGGTAFCAICKENTFSLKGASQCTVCKKDIEYAEPASSYCKKRPPCSSRDYYEYQTPCDENKQTRKIYQWIQPQICNQNSPGSVRLPLEGNPEACPPCNPGMHVFNDSDCVFCPANQYSDGSKPCAPCPASTSPEYGIDYRWWTSMPPNVTSHCLSMIKEKCSPQAGWLLANDHIRSHFGHERDVFLILTLKISGFRGQPHDISGKADILSHVSFTFETNCTSKCEFVFLSDEIGRNTITKTWLGSHPKTQYNYPVRTNKSLVVTWAFQPANWDDENDEEDVFDYLGNVAKIYSIKVTNTIGGGAAGCQPCPRGTQKDGCIPCPEGHYIDTKSATCQPCPANTVLSGNDAWGIKACKPCGAGLTAVGGKTCESNCRHIDGEGKEYNFTKLSGLQYIVANKLFTSSGTQYYHGFNVSLCGKILPTCVNNVTEDVAGKKKSEDVEVLAHKGIFGKPSKLAGMVCRSTMVPTRKVGEQIFSTQPVSLGDHLIKIESNISMVDQYKEEGFPPEDEDKDIHFYYKSENPTSACPNGRQTIISLRCDVKQDGQGTIDLPPKCSDGTCDGCTFHFLWRSQHACPICKEKDYEVIKGECISGEQTIHYYPPKHCLLLDNQKPKQMKQKCTMLPFGVQIAIPVVIGIGLLLLILLVYCWKRNKKLEYKYMKLVETAGGRDGELPGVESCAVDEGDDDDTVHFADKGVSIFQKLKNKISSSSKDDDNPFVSVRMHEKVPLT